MESPTRRFVAAVLCGSAVLAGHGALASRPTAVSHQLPGEDSVKTLKLTGTGEALRYRLYAPSAAKRGAPLPLIIALHGYGGREDTWFDAFGGALPRLAEARSYLVAAPAAYPRGASIGWSPMPEADAVSRTKQQISEKLVLAVLADVRRHHPVDDRSRFLLGHSMGGLGAWAIAARFPDLWAAVAPLSAPRFTGRLPAEWRIPAIVVHGTDDPAVDVSVSRAAVAAVRAAGGLVHAIEVPGGRHGDVVEAHLPVVFDFFDAHRRR